MRAIERVETRRPFIGVNEIDLPARHQRGQLRDPGRPRTVLIRSGRNEFEIKVADVVDERSRLSIDEDFMSRGRRRGGKVDRVDLTAADSKVMGIDD